MFHITQRSGSLTKSPDHHKITWGDGVKAVWVAPTPHFIFGKLACWVAAANVECVRLPGYWIDQDPSLPAGTPWRPGDKVAYRLHGGAYIQLSAHPRDPSANIAKGILKHSPSITRTFGVEYRLSTTDPYEETNPFPTALVDALAGYLYLLAIGFHPEDIVLVGDSAGANLALALVRYLLEHRAAHPSLPEPPTSMLLLSPWADLGTSHWGPHSSIRTHYSTDYLGGRAPRRMNYSKAAFLGPFGFAVAERCPYISPASLHPGVNARFTGGWPRTLICGGGQEPLLDSILSLRWKMERDMGVGGPTGVEYFQAPDALHDWLLFPWHQPEVDQTLVRISKWLVEY
ncbi:alpha beta-hydrolase [Coniophora puteana RWD-64-598 SS2]|uniref:Alpha beta-hydrolase n=1 Tax=Coniophora puteana (strain RWD-64-598) TaxID=741705 RepID=A0A5M3N463_CONPW|nr:alpha beta-hydrolase [Coniophora puteana RWD-64-598 SS2]EIW86047.1 alpha beta-hydrolase [Coniophora puteana RWD-64-598 SS2]